MGCCASNGGGKSGVLRRDHLLLGRPRVAPTSPGLEFRSIPRPRTVVNEIMSESPLPKGDSPEVREGDKARRFWVGDEAAAEIVSEYSEMCGAASGSLSTTTRVAATEKIDQEVKSGDIREPRRERRVNADRYRSPVKAQSKRSSAAGLTLVSQREGPRQLGRRRDFSRELRARRRNAGSSDRGAGANSRRLSISMAPAPRWNGGVRAGRGGECGSRLAPKMEAP
ncbi:hypothetical protein SAY86_017407 [Trapa natans]|uniref:Uncharacterized protein n=1 Tax=Trapa natans TaxID=22666 RepID=A0AAN7M1I3_TRANT|nr:hypothetical protein SAY86_017407 [Trapa natans]